MSYTALYRKFRPAEFGDVKRAGSYYYNITESDQRQTRIGHAYLFCGTRGTGKNNGCENICESGKL